MIVPPLQKQQAVTVWPAMAEAAEPRATMPLVPVLPSTLLGLELLSLRPAFDLRAAARVVRDDPGAVLAVFAASARESTNTAPSMRLENCLATLSRDRLLHALAGVRGVQHPRFSIFLHHAAAVSRNAVAAAAALGLPEEPAQLLGLLHELGGLPRLLGWSSWPADAVTCCDRLALSHGLPSSLRQALGEVHRQQSGSVWVAVIRAAHELLQDIHNSDPSAPRGHSPETPA